MEENFPIRDELFSDFYETISDIGRGKFALVKKCKHLDSGVEFAAKFLRKRRCGKDCRAAIIREIAMLKAALSHPRVINVIEVFETRQEIIIVTEYAAGGELFQHMVVEDCFEEQDVIRLMRQIIDGVRFLHDASIVHLDIKPQNILLTETPPCGDIKLCDFGFARHVKKGSDILDIVGTPDYVAPEVLSYEPIQTACDMWSIGVLTYVMLTGCSPFAADTKQETFLNISQVNLDFPEELYNGISNDAIDFITALLVKDPKQRMTVNECAKHKWLSNDKKPLGSLALTPMISPIVSSPLGSRRALSSSSDNSALPEPVKRQCCVEDNHSRLTPPLSTQEITVESSQHTTVHEAKHSVVSVVIDAEDEKDEAKANSSTTHSSTLSFEIKDCHVVPQERNTTPVKSFTVTKEFMIESKLSTRHKEISLQLDVRPLDENSIVIEHSPLLVRRSDTKRQLVC